MQAMLEQTSGDLEIDRSDWELVKFGDVAIQQKGTVDRENTDLTRYVKGEHMYSEDLHLREWGELKDEYLGPAFIRKFEEGDILYGSRRTYLRKVVVAPFDGITSNTTFVAKANEKRIDKRLLPFVMLSEGFSLHSIQNSKGSVNPYVNWKDLSGYEFLLPPLSKQKDILDLLQGIDLSIQADIELRASLGRRKTSFFNSAIYTPVDSLGEFGRKKSNFPVHKLGELATRFQYGISESLENSGDIPVLRMNNLQNGVLDINDLKFVAENYNNLDDFILNQGDILFNRTNSYELVGKTCIFNEEKRFSFASYLIRIVTDKSKLLPEYLNFYMNSPIGLSKIRKYRTPGVSQSNINANNLKRLLIPTPDLEFQKHLMSQVFRIEFAENSVNTKVCEGKALLLKLVNQVF